MDERKLQLIAKVVDAYISTAHPVGSQVLVQRYRLSWSTATIRNDLLLLEQAGYIFQPHTSAGRVPTHHGYQLYLEHAKTFRLHPSLERSLHEMSQQLTSSDDLQELCRVLSQLSEEVVFAVTTLGTFITGMRFIAKKPEVVDRAFVSEITAAIDALDTLCDTLALEGFEGVYRAIGDDESFGASCSALVVRIPFQRASAIIGILGPLRMDYGKNIALLTAISH
ncbi:MAG: hypothetical protein AAB855_03600 [Patescibacteria group bacterium]